MSMSVSIQRSLPKLWLLLDIRLLVLVASLIAAGMFLKQPTESRLETNAAFASSLNEQLNAKLKQAAVESLAQREGTILIIDPQNGGLRAVLNPDVAFGQAFAPGSTIKPFAVLAAMRSGLVDRNTRTLCQTKYSHADFQTVCSHPAHLGPLSPAEAIAYSCNYYFGKLGERLRESELTTTLAGFGFGVKSGIQVDNESSGILRHGEWHAENVLGEGNYLQVTPIQLLMAYSAMVNGGRLLTPVMGGREPLLRTRIEITNEEQSVLLEGLRGAVRFGTAEHSELNSLPLYIMGKTGTSTPVVGFRTQGWFIGFAADVKNDVVNPTLGVLVFLKRGHGADAASVSRQIFAAYATEAADPVKVDALTSQVKFEIPDKTASSKTVRVHLAREDVTRTLPLEDYVLGVVAVEGSVETELEALKALAVASRTYALRNLGRHKSEGFDFCSSTHCQRFLPAFAKVSDVVRAAVTQTAGQILTDNNGRLVDSYFSASCGGQTANIATLWGTGPQSYLGGVTDEFCTSMPHSHWADIISTADLLRALRNDPQTDAGPELKDVTVARRDQTGRAEQVRVVGQHQLSVSGWTFKLIVGRTLGWNFIKSSRFQILRSGSNFVFRGSGFGHGLGLCQEGAHVMAERGYSYSRILGKYFPGTQVRVPREAAPYRGFELDLLRSAAKGTSTKSVTIRTARGRLQISSEHFRIDYPFDVKRSDAEYLLHVLEASRTDLLRRSSLPWTVRMPFIEVFANNTTGDFVSRTGLPWWAAAGSREQRIELQPIQLLRRRGILETTLRHELVHKVIDQVGNEQTPRWLAEGLALYLAGEGSRLHRPRQSKKMSVAELEQRLSTASDGIEMRELYAVAYDEVHRLINTEGEASVWRRVGNGRD